eukprot:664517-Prymnesium_polylepis.2
MSAELQINTQANLQRETDNATCNPQARADFTAVNDEARPHCGRMHVRLGCLAACTQKVVASERARVQRKITTRLTVRIERAAIQLVPLCI